MQEILDLFFEMIDKVFETGLNMSGEDIDGRQVHAYRLIINANDAKAHIAKLFLSKIDSMQYAEDLFLGIHKSTLMIAQPILGAINNHSKEQENFFKAFRRMDASYPLSLFSINIHNLIMGYLAKNISEDTLDKTLHIIINQIESLKKLATEYIKFHESTPEFKEQSDIFVKNMLENALTFDKVSFTLKDTIPADINNSFIEYKFTSSIELNPKLKSKLSQRVYEYLNKELSNVIIKIPRKPNAPKTKQGNEVIDFTFLAEVFDQKNNGNDLPNMLFEIRFIDKFDIVEISGSRCNAHGIKISIRSNSWNAIGISKDAAILPRI